MATIPSIAMIPSGYKAGKLYSVLPTNGDGDFTTTRNTVATRLNENGLIEEVASNVPRLDYSDGGCPSLLLEPLSTNLIQYSEDFSDASWGRVKGGVSTIPAITSNYSTSPDGTVNADRLIFDLNGGTTSSDFSQLQSSTFVMNADYSNSIWLKSNTASSYVMSFLKPSGNVTTITVTTEWQRFENSIAVSTTTAPIRLRLRSSESTSVYADISIWGAQLEQQSYATSYIKNEGTALGVTRVADTVNGAGDATVINSTEGVLFAEISALADNSSMSGADVSVSDTTTSNTIRLIYSPVTSLNSILVRIDVGGVRSASFDYVGITTTNFNKFAVKWKENDFALWVNGIEVLTDLNGATFPLSTLTKVNFNSGSGINPFKGKTKDLRVYNTALSDLEIEKLSSWTSFTAMANGQSYTII